MYEEDEEEWDEEGKEMKRKKISIITKFEIIISERSCY
jgi:hypothetical protein